MVTKCEKAKEWNGKPIYAIGLSDGQGGESFQQIPVGTPLTELVITENGQYSAKIKWNKPGASNAAYMGKQRSGNESFALSYAKDYGVAVISSGKPFKCDDVLALADKFYNWLENKKAPEKPPLVLASQLPQNTAQATQKGNEDLPF